MLDALSDFVSWKSRTGIKNNQTPTVPLLGDGDDAFKLYFTQI
jgi:hypothetical protein